MGGLNAISLFHISKFSCRLLDFGTQLLQYDGDVCVCVCVCVCACARVRVCTHVGVRAMLFVYSCM